MNSKWLSLTIRPTAILPQRIAYDSHNEMRREYLHTYLSHTSRNVKLIIFSNYVAVRVLIDGIKFLVDRIVEI